MLFDPHPVFCRLYSSFLYVICAVFGIFGILLTSHAANAAGVAWKQEGACYEGDVRECLNAGFMYSVGFGGLPADQTKAVFFYQKACDGAAQGACTMLTSFGQ